MGKRTLSTDLGSLASGAVTALALAVQTGLAALVGVIIARELGHSAETDGFFAAYGVFIVLALAANAIRVTLLPSFARGRAERRLGAEVAASAFLLSLVAIPVVIVGIAAAGPVAGLLTGEGSDVARTTAASVLPWMVAAGVCQVYAGLAASALAALDDYVTAALGFVGGSVAGITLILFRISDDGAQAVAWGMALNGAIALSLPTLALARRARAERMPSGAVRPVGLSLALRMRLMGSGIALPLALQAIYVICLPLASREGEGAVTSFGYAYLFSSAVVAVTASSLGIVTTVPLTRRGLGNGRATKHIVSSAWIGVVAVGLTTGVFAVAGGAIVEALLGSSYATETGTEVGRLVALLSPWAIASVGVSVTFPLLFVHGRGWWLPLLSVGVVVLHLAVALVSEALLGLDGLALSLTFTTGVILLVMLAALGSAWRVLAGLSFATAIVGAIAGGAFVLPWALLEPVPAAIVGAVVYVTLLLVVRPKPLRAAWRYLRALT